jgi:hypothetical protein
MATQVNKNSWLWAAPDYFSRWRVFPRAFVVVYFWLIIQTALWFMGLPTPSTAQAAFASAVISAGAVWFGLYVNSGPAETQTLVAPQSVAVTSLPAAPIAKPNLSPTTTARPSVVYRPRVIAKRDLPTLDTTYTTEG